MSTIVHVDPIYGNGWTDGDQTIEVPSVFDVTVDQIGTELIGEVVSGQYAGWDIRLSPRFAGPFNGFCNVVLSMNAADGRHSGYANIPVEALSI